MTPEPDPDLSQVVLGDTTLDMPTQGPPSPELVPHKAMSTENGKIDSPAASQQDATNTVYSTLTSTEQPSAMASEAKVEDTGRPVEPNTPAALQQDETHLPSPPGKDSIHSQSPSQDPHPTSSFVRRIKQGNSLQTGDKGKGKQKAGSSGSDSTPLTRQGYRLGRLAEDFWTAVGIPSIPQATQKKKL